MKAGRNHKTLRSEAKDFVTQSLGQEDPLMEVMTTYTNILAYRISWTEKPGKPQFIA